MTRVRVALAAAALLVVGAVGIAGAGISGGPRIKSTKGWIEALAMDGPLVAYGVGATAGADCNKLFVWNVQTSGGRLVSGPGTCDAGSTSTGAGVREIAVAGSRVAWIVNRGGNTESLDTLYTAALPKAKETKLAETVRTGDVDGGLKGDWLGGLVGDGDVLAANFWTTDSKGTVTRSSLRALPSLATIVGGPASLTARSADLGRIAVLSDQGLVTIYSSAGLLLRTIKPSSVQEIALRKDYLVALTRSKTLEIFNANTGAAVRTWPVPAGAAHLDVHSGIAVYAVGRRVRAIRLTTGKDVVLAAAKRKIVDVELEAPGVAYAFNTLAGVKEIGNVAFVPIAKVIAAVS